MSVFFQHCWKRSPEDGRIFDYFSFLYIIYSAITLANSSTSLNVISLSSVKLSHAMLLYCLVEANSSTGNVKSRTFWFAFWKCFPYSWNDKKIRIFLWSHKFLITSLWRYLRHSNFLKFTRVVLFVMYDVIFIWSLNCAWPEKNDPFLIWAMNLYFK